MQNVPKVPIVRAYFLFKPSGRCVPLDNNMRQGIRREILHSYKLHIGFPVTNNSYRRWRPFAQRKQLFQIRMVVPVFRQLKFYPNTFS